MLVPRQQSVLRTLRGPPAPRNLFIPWPMAVNSRGDRATIRSRIPSKVIVPLKQRINRKGRKKDLAFLNLCRYTLGFPHA